MSGLIIPILQMKNLSPEEDKSIAHLSRLLKFGPRLFILAPGGEGGVLEMLGGVLVSWLRLLSSLLET